MAQREFHSAAHLRSRFGTSGIISPTFTSGVDINDANPTGLGASYIINWDVDFGGQRLSGVVAPAVEPINGARLIIRNSSNDRFRGLILNESTASTAENRFSLPCPVLFLPVNACAEFVYLTSDNRWHLLNSGGMDPSHSRMFNPHLFDDFASGSNETGEAGELGWAFVNGTFVPSSPVTYSPDLNGLYIRQTGTTANQICSTFPAGSTVEAAPSKFEDWESVTFKLAMGATVNTFILRFGIGRATANPPTNGVYFERLAADTSIFGVSRASGVGNRTAALLAQDTVFHTFRVSRASATTLVWVVDEGAQVFQTPANIPAGASGIGGPFIQIITTNTTARFCTVDYMRCDYRTGARK